METTTNKVDRACAKEEVLDHRQHVRVFVMVAQTIETSNYVGTKMSGICCMYKCVRMPSDCRMFGIKYWTTRLLRLDPLSYETFDMF